MPEGKRKATLSAWLEGMRKLFAGRILGFDEQASLSYAHLAVQARAAGKAFPLADGYIAAIAHSQGYQVATRDGTAFKAAGLRVTNPWQLVQPRPF